MAALILAFHQSTDCFQIVVFTLVNKEEGKLGVGLLFNDYIYTPTSTEEISKEGNGTKKYTIKLMRQCHYIIRKPISIPPASYYLV